MSCTLSQLNVPKFKPSSETPSVLLQLTNLRYHNKMYPNWNLHRRQQVTGRKSLAYFIPVRCTQTQTFIGNSKRPAESHWRTERYLFKQIQNLIWESKSSIANHKYMNEAMTATHQFSKNDFILSDIVTIVHLMSLIWFPFHTQIICYLMRCLSLQYNSWCVLYNNRVLSCEMNDNWLSLMFSTKVCS